MATDYTDSATIDSSTTPSSVQVFEAVDAATIASTTTPSAAEARTITDAATIAGVTALSVVEEFKHTVPVFIGSIETRWDIVDEAAATWDASVQALRWEGDAYQEGLSSVR